MLSTTYAKDTHCAPQEVSQHLAANWAGYRGSNGPKKGQRDLDRLAEQSIIDCLQVAAGNRGGIYQIRPFEVTWPKLEKDQATTTDGEGTQNSQAPTDSVPPEGTQNANCVPPEGTQSGVYKENPTDKKKGEEHTQKKKDIIPPSQLKEMINQFLPTLGRPGIPPTNLGTESKSPAETPAKASAPTKAPEAPQEPAATPEPSTAPVTVEAPHEAATDTQEPNGEAALTVATAEPPVPGSGVDMDLDELLALETPAMAPSAPAIEEIQEQLEHHRSGQDEWQTSQRVQALGGGIDLRRRKRRITTIKGKEKKVFYRFGGGKAQALGRDANRFLGQLRPKKGGAKN